MNYTLSNPISEKEIINLKTSKKWKLSDFSWEDTLKLLDKDIDTFMIGLLREEKTEKYNKKLNTHFKYSEIKKIFKTRTDEIINSLDSSKPQKNWPKAIIYSIQNGGYAFEKLAQFLQKYPNIKFEHRSNQKDKTQWIIHNPKLHTFKTPNTILKEMICILGIEKFKEIYSNNHNLNISNPIINIINKKETTFKEFQDWALKGVNLKGITLPEKLFKISVYESENPVLTYSKINPTNLLLIDKEDLKIFENENLLSHLLNERNDTWEIIDKQLNEKINISNFTLNMLTEFYNSKPQIQKENLESEKKIHRIIEYIEEKNISFFITENTDVNDLAKCIIKRPELQNLLPIIILENFEKAKKISLKNSIKEKINSFNNKEI